jgi:Protein of unknown function (DUF3727)
LVYCTVQVKSSFCRILGIQYTGSFFRSCCRQPGETVVPLKGTMRIFRTFLLLSILLWMKTDAFTGSFHRNVAARTTFLFPHAASTPFLRVDRRRCRSAMATSSDAAPELKRVPPDMEGVPIPFVDVAGNSFIECYADSVAIVNGIEYTIGVPCDYSVALCFFDENDQLVPVELDDALMDDIFPLAESIVSEEFGEELVLQRTPQTLTLVGELEDDDEEEDDDDDENEDEDDEEEEVEVLLSFEHRDKEYNLVRLLDPIMLVAKIDPAVPDNRILLTPEESEEIMPILEEMFLEFNDGPDDLLP